MKLLCCDWDAELCELMKTKLESKGIACVVKEADETPLLGQHAPGPTADRPCLWIGDDDRFEEAWDIVNGAAADDSADAEPAPATETGS